MTTAEQVAEQAPIAVKPNSANNFRKEVGKKHLGMGAVRVSRPLVPKMITLNTQDAVRVLESHAVVFDMSAAAFAFVYRVYKSAGKQFFHDLASEVDEKYTEDLKAAHQEIQNMILQAETFAQENSIDTNLAYSNPREIKIDITVPRSNRMLALVTSLDELCMMQDVLRLREAINEDESYKAIEAATQVVQRTLRRIEATASAIYRATMIRVMNDYTWSTLRQRMSKYYKINIDERARAVGYVPYPKFGLLPVTKVEAGGAVPQADDSAHADDAGPTPPAVPPTKRSKKSVASPPEIALAAA